MTGRVLDDASAAAITAAILTVAITLLSMDGPRWERRYRASARAHDQCARLVDLHYRNRPKKLYQFVQELALRAPVAGRRDRYRLRARLALQIPSARLKEANRAARDWIASVGAFAEEARTQRVELRSFLGTYHLGVIREGVIAVPIALSLMSRGELKDEEVDQLAWGLALIELASRYNAVARQQRQPIYFLAVDHHPPIGPVLNAPSAGSALLRDLHEVLGLPLRLSALGRWRWRRWLERIAATIEEPH